MMKSGLVCLLLTGFLLLGLQGHAITESQKNSFNNSVTENIHNNKSPELKRSQTLFALPEEYLLNDDDDDEFTSLRKKKLIAHSYSAFKPAFLQNDHRNSLNSIQQSHGNFIYLPSNKYIFQRVIRV